MTHICVGDNEARCQRTNRNLTKITQNDIEIDLVIYF